MKKINIENDPVKLLWTGGWDSTFQLLQLLFVYKSKVIPFYLIHEDRPSTGIEIMTMKRIKSYLFKKFPHTKDLLEPTRFYAMNDLVPNQEISDAYHGIKEEKHIGLQYAWLARLCREEKINDMQLSVEKSMFPIKNHWDTDLDKMLMETKVNSQSVYIMDPKYKETKEYLLFKYFSFPIIKITKKEMSHISANKGWDAIMQMTWFCHYPTKNKKPCGKCKPCLSVIQEGFGARISTKRRFVSYTYSKTIWPLKSVLRPALVQIGFVKNSR